MLLSPQPVRSVSLAPSTNASTAGSSNATSAAMPCGKAQSSGKGGGRRRNVNGLTDFRLEWDSFWSAYHAKREEKGLFSSKFAGLHEYKEMLKERTGVPSHILGNGYLSRHIKVYPSLHK